MNIKTIKENDELIEEQKRIKMSEYYDKNKERILNSRKKTFKCDCGKIITIGSRYAHNNTIIHKRLIKNLEMN